MKTSSTTAEEFKPEGSAGKAKISSFLESMMISFPFNLAYNLIKTHHRGRKRNVPRHAKKLNVDGYLHKVKRTIVKMCWRVI